MVILIIPKDFAIRSMRDAKYFIEKVLVAPESISIPDVNDKKMYYELICSKQGKVSMGHAHYGKDPLTAETPCCDDDNIVQRIFYARKSINCYLKSQMKK